MFRSFFTRDVTVALKFKWFIKLFYLEYVFAIGHPGIAFRKFIFRSIFLVHSRLSVARVLLSACRVCLILRFS